MKFPKLFKKSNVSKDNMTSNERIKEAINHLWEIGVTTGLKDGYMLGHIKGSSRGLFHALASGAKGTILNTKESYNQAAPFYEKDKTSIDHQAECEQIIANAFKKSKLSKNEQLFCLQATVEGHQEGYKRGYFDGFEDGIIYGVYCCLKGINPSVAEAGNKLTARSYQRMDEIDWETLAKELTYSGGAFAGKP